MKNTAKLIYTLTALLVFTVITACNSQTVKVEDKQTKKDVINEIPEKRQKTYNNKRNSRILMIDVE